MLHMWRASGFQLFTANRHTTGVVTVRTTAVIQRPHEVTIVCPNSSQEKDLPYILRCAQDFRMKQARKLASG